MWTTKRPTQEGYYLAWGPGAEGVEIVEFEPDETTGKVWLTGCDLPMCGSRVTHWGPAILVPQPPIQT